MVEYLVCLLFTSTVIQIDYKNCIVVFVYKGKKERERKKNARKSINIYVKQDCRVC